MALHTLWSGYIRFSLVTIPVRLYSAVDASTRIHFNQLHEADHGRVGYDKKCKSCGDSLHSDQIVKGYEYAPDQYVIVTADDLKALKLKSTRILEMEAFVTASEIDHTLYDTPYFIGPDGDVAAKGYSLLAAALAASGKMGIGKLVLRDREDMVLVGPRAGRLMLYKVRYPQAVRDITQVPGVTGQDVLDEELQLAQSLIETMSTSFAQIELKGHLSPAREGL